MPRHASSGRARDVRMIPVAAACWLGAAVTTGEYSWRWALPIAGVATLLMTLWQRRWWFAAAAMGLVGSSMVAGLWVYALRHNDLAHLADESAVVRVTVRVLAEHREVSGPGEPRALVPVTVLWVEGRGQAWTLGMPAEVSAPVDSAARLGGAPGSTWTFTARARPAQPGHRTSARLTLGGEPTRLADPALPAHMVNRVRAGLRDAMAGRPQEQAGLVPAMVVGDTSRLPDKVVDNFRATGLTHLTAVSGTNLTLMLSFVIGMAGWLGVQGRKRRLLSVAVVVSFVVLCRAEPSVVRAAAMGVVALAATGARNDQAGGLRTLSVAIVVLVLVEPWLARSWGFALSVSATAGILIWGGQWQRAMRVWAPAPLAEAVCIPLAAQLATQPISTALSGNISVTAVLANGLVAPFVAPITILGLIVALLSPVLPAAAETVGWLAGWCAQPLLLVAERGAALTTATVPWPTSAAGLAVLTVSCLTGGVAVGRLVHHRLATAAVGVIMLAALAVPPPTPGWPGEWRVVFCDVGQGDATAIRAGPGQVVLVDLGPEAMPTLRCLASLSTRELPFIVLTHLHADHVGGLAGVLERYPVGVLVLGEESPDADRRLVKELADRYGVQVLTAAAGEEITAGEMTWRNVSAKPALALTALGEGESAAENDASLVGVVTAGCVRSLIGGDVEPAGQQAVVASRADLGVDVLKLPHHGSARQDEEFFAATGARVAIASVAARNTYGHPALRTVALASGLGMRVLRTDVQGSIAVGCAASSLTVITQR